MKQLTLAIPDLPFAAEEALNRLRLNIKFVGPETKNIMVTSSVENEGKTSVAIYLWKKLAETGAPTLYIDLDLRKSVIADRYGIKKDDKAIGVEHYLSGMASFEDAIHSTNIQNGFMMICVNCLENPFNLF